jgi:isoleucyl-tRNA synthetase
VAGPSALGLEPYRELIADELNVKAVHLSSDVSEVADLLLQVNPAALGPRLGAATQQVIKAVRQGQWARTPQGDVEVAGHVLAEGEYFLSLVPKDPDASRALPGNDGVVTLSLEVTPELAREGLARDVVRQVQVARKDAGLDVSDHIRLVLYFPPPELRRAAEEHGELIAAETLADEIVFSDSPISESSRATVADGRAFLISIVKLPRER